MNNNRQDANALLAGGRGVFAASSYVTVGTKEEPFPYVQHPVERDSFKGKQLATVPPKQGRTPDTYFEKKHLYLGEGLLFVDRLKYGETQKDELKPQKGFCTSDFSRRDEFSSTFRTEQYREQLKQEGTFAKRALAEALEKSGGGEPGGQGAPAEPETLLYDLVYEKPDYRGTGASRPKHDTRNRTWLSHQRDLGPYRTTMSLAHQAPGRDDLHCPQHGHNAVVERTFFQKGRLCLV